MWHGKKFYGKCYLVEQEGILYARAYIRWKTMAWAHQIWWLEIENSREVKVLLEAISLVLWISHFPTKNVLHDKNRTFSKRDFSAVGFRDFLKTLKTQRQKSLFLYKSARFSLTKQCIFYGLISKLMVLPYI